MPKKTPRWEKFMEMTPAERAIIRNDVMVALLDALVPGRPGFSAAQLQHAQDKLQTISRAMFWRTL